MFVLGTLNRAPLCKFDLMKGGMPELSEQMGVSQDTFTVEVVAS